MASLVSPNCNDTQNMLAYVFDELIRNAIQHSCDPDGAVVCAQRMDPRHEDENTVIQLCVADAGIGIPASLAQKRNGVVDGLAALSVAIEPHVSGAFEKGAYGSSDNAGLGLFVTTEIVKRTAGKTLLASRGGSLFIQGDPKFASNHRVATMAGAYPGTLVAFEMNVIGADGSVIPDTSFDDLLAVILNEAERRNPGKGTSGVLDFSPPPGWHRVLASLIIGSLEDVEKLRAPLQSKVEHGQSVTVDFLNVPGVTQSQVHALLFDLIRKSAACGSRVGILNATPTVRSVLEFLESYALK